MAESAPSLPRTVPVLHGLAIFLLSTNAIVQMLPLVAIRQFGAGNWQTFAITAAVPTLLSAAIFWHALLNRLGLRRYLIVHWCAAYLPLAAMGLAQNYWQLLAAHLVAAAGAGGWSPVAGILLKRIYPDRVRGRAYGILSVITLVGQMIALYVAGRWLTADGEAFRRFLPLYAVLQGTAIAILAWIGTRGEPDNGAAASQDGSWLRRLLAPLARTLTVLREDRRFRRYEQAFMTYGCGWQIGDVLLPLLVTHRLQMPYDDVAASVHATFRAAMIVTAIPTGWIMDRLGPARTAAIAFGGLIIYPLLLLAATRPMHVAIASGVYGIVMSAVSVAWMLGPVTFARSPERVSEYVAIHATLVGLRGILFQFLGMLLFSMTGDFFWPMVIASVSFAWAAQQMWSLHRDDVRARPATADGPTATNHPAAGFSAARRAAENASANDPPDAPQPAAGAPGEPTRSPKPR